MSLGFTYSPPVVAVVTSDLLIILLLHHLDLEKNVIKISVVIVNARKSIVLRFIPRSEL